MSRRWLPVIVFAAFALGMIVMTSAQDRDPFGEANPGPAEAKAEESPGLELSDAKAPTREDLRNAMNTAVPVDFDDDPLIDVMKILAKGTGINIMVDQQALAEEGVRVDEGITMKGQPIAAARLLDRMLDPLGLTWVIEDQVVKVTTIIAAEEKLYTVTYPVGDLLEFGEEHQNENLAAAQTSRLQYVQFGDAGCGGPGGFIGGVPGPGDWLTALLQEMTPGPWEDFDGEGGSLSLIKDSLSVRQTQQNHEQIEKILSTIRDFTKGELKPTAVPIQPPHYAVDEDEVVKQTLTKVVSMKARDVPLKDLIQHLGERLGVAVYIDVQALTEEGIPVDEPLNFELKNLPADSLLQIALEPLGLRHIVDDGQLFVTTNIAAEERLVTIVHDVRDLSDAEYTGTELVDVFENETSGPWEDIDGSGGHVQIPLNGLLVIRQTQKVHNEVAAILSDLRKQLAESEAKAEKKEPSDPQAVTTKFYAQNLPGSGPAVQHAITTLVEPKTWSENGGEGEILLIDNLLVIKAKNEVHSQVQQFLKDFRKARGNIVPPMGGGSFGGGGLGGGQGGMGAGEAGGGGFFSDKPNSI